MSDYFPWVKRYLLNIRDGLVSTGRLYALQALCEPALTKKSDIVATAFTYIEAAAQVSDFLSRTYALKTPLIYWWKNINPLFTEVITASTEVNSSKLETSIHSMTVATANSIHQLDNFIEKLSIFSPIKLFLPTLKRLFPKAMSNLTLENLQEEDKSVKSNGVFRAIQGPSKISIDKIFEPSFSLLEYHVPTYQDNLERAAPYYWCLAARECLASDMCSLSLLEYDGMPIHFYRDMAKQAWDEARHAIFFLNSSLELLINLKQMLNSTHPLFRIIQNYEIRGQGLPIPLEGNLYEAIWNASLQERLILMHIDTETPGIKRVKGKISSSLSKQYPQISSGLKVVMYEEISHARLGKNWLKYLLPMRDKRDATIRETRLLRGILLLTSFVHPHKQPLKDILMSIISKNDTESRKAIADNEEKQATSQILF